MMVREEEDEQLCVCVLVNTILITINRVYSSWLRSKRKIYWKITGMHLGTKEGNIIRVSLGIGTKYLKTSRNQDNYSLSLAFCLALLDSDTLFDSPA